MRPGQKIVCIAEDNPDLRQIFATVFDPARFYVRVAIDGREALAQINELPPDLLVLDVNMPYLSGLEVLRQLRENPFTRHTKVIVVTGNTQTQAAPEADLADLLLIKPVDVFELMTFVERFLGA